MLRNFQRPILGIALSCALSTVAGCSPDAAMPVARSEGEIPLSSPQPQSETLPEPTSTPMKTPSSGEGKSTDPERIRAVLAQLAAKRQGITSYTMDISWERREFAKTPIDEALPQGTVVRYGHGTWMMKGDMWRVHRKKRWERPERPDDSRIRLPENYFDKEPYETWVVYNPEYFARFEGNISLYPHDVVDAGAVAPEPEQYPFPLQWGFGSGAPVYLDQSLEELADPARYRWVIEEFQDDDGPKIRVRCYSGQNSGMESILDPNRDFLVVESTNIGERFIKSNVELQQLADGRWFPKQIVKRRRDNVQTFSIGNVELNKPLEDSEFYIDAFEFDRESTYLIKRDALQRGERMLFRDGQWIPVSIVPDSSRPKKQVQVYRSVNGQDSVTTEER